MSESETDALHYQKWFESFYTESPSLLPPFIPDDLVWHILLFLPVKDLLRVRCVCKSWNSIISNSLFAKDHLRRSIQDPTLTNHHLLLPVLGPDPVIFVSYSIKSVFNEPLTTWGYIDNLRLPLPLTATEYTILGWCHCFICLMSRNDRRETHLRLSNPSTGMVSPETPSIGCCMGPQDLCGNSIRRRLLVRKGVRQWDFIGFGYDSVSDRYKAVVIFRGRSEHQITITKVYSFGNTSWTTYQNSNICGYSMIAWDVAFLDSNSTLNWLAVDARPREFRSLPERVGRTYLIVNFDLTTERTGNIWLPDHDFDMNAYKLGLGVLKGYLSIFHSVEQRSEVHIWMMKDYGITGSWVNMISVPYVGLPLAPASPICMSEIGEVLLRHWRSMVFNPHTNTMRYPAFQPLQKHCQHKQHIYIEGLLSPHF